MFHKLIKSIKKIAGGSDTVLQVAALEAAANAVVITDITGRIKWVNDSFLKLTGYDRTEAEDKKISLLVKSGEHDNLFYKKLWDTILSGTIWKGVITNRKKDGTLYLEEQTITPVFGEKNKIVNFISIKEDITDKIRMEKALNDSELRWQFALEGAGDGLWDWNVQTGRVFFSKQWKAMFGYSEEEIGDTIDEWEKRVHPDDIKRCLEDIEKHFRGETAIYKNEHRVLCKDGTYRWILDRGNVVSWDIDAKPIRVIGTHTDISERKKIEDAVKSERDLFTGGPAVVLIWKNKPGWPVEFVSTNSEQQLGYTQEEMTSPGFFYGSLVYREDSQRVLNEVELFIRENRTSWEQQYRIVKKDGTVKWFYDYTFIEKSSTGEILRIRGYIIDQTAVKETESNLRRQEKRLELFFQQSLDGFFFMMLDEPVLWNEGADKDSLLDYIFINQRITHANQAMANQYGVEVERFIGLTPADFYRHDLRYGKSVWKDFFDHGRLHIETKERKFDNTPVYIEGDYICLYEDDGRISGHFGIQRDVTARKNAEDALREKSEEMERFFTVALDLLCIADTEGHFIRVNRAWERTLGYAIEELQGKSLLEFVHPEDIQSTKQSLAALSDQIPVLNFTNRYRTSDGSYRFIEWRSYPSGKYIYAAARDITERIQYEFELNKLAERLTLATGSARIGIWDWDIVNEELIWDKQMYELYGIKDGKPSGVYELWKKIVHSEDQEYIESLFLRGVKELEGFHANFRIIWPDSSIHYLEAHARVIRDKNDKAVRITGVNWDVSESKLMEEKLFTLSTTDPLTTAYNRRYLLQVLESEISRAGRYNAVFSLIMFDIDHFKNVNDTYGHDAGDEVLKGIVSIMQKRIRKNDVLARWGGEEFMILLSGTNTENAMLFAEKLIVEVRSMVFGICGSVTASFGVTGYRNNESSDSVLKRVDELVYLAKSEGRDCVRVS